MSSKLDICNLALAHLGMNAIADLTTSNPQSRACNTFYTPSLDEVFRELAWPFATIQEELVENATEIIGWTSVYDYPTGAATVWAVYDEATVEEKYNQDFEVLLSSSSTTGEKVICSNLSGAYADYTFKTTDTTLYDPKFIMAFSYKLAANMAHTLIGDIKKAINILEIYNAVISEAKRMSSIEKRKKPKQVSSYQNSRG